MRKKSERLEPGGLDRLNSNPTTLLVLGCYSPSSRSLLFLYQCSSVCICGFKAFIQPTQADSAAAIPVGAGRAGAGALAPRREFRRATMPPGARVRAARSRAA